MVTTNFCSIFASNYKELVQLSENMKLDEAEDGSKQEEIDNSQNQPQIPTEDEYETIKLISNGAYGLARTRLNT